MTKEGIYKCLALLKLEYKNQFNFDEKELMSIANEWNLQFKSFNDYEVNYAIQYHISISPYVPHISDLKGILFNQYMNESKTKTLSDEEAWELLLKACGNSLYHASEEWNKLPNDIKCITTVGTLREMATSSIDSLKFVKRDFLNNYHDIINAQKQESKNQFYIKSLESLNIPQSDDSKKLNLTTKEQ